MRITRLLQHLRTLDSAKHVTLFGSPVGGEGGFLWEVWCPGSAALPNMLTRSRPAATSDSSVPLAARGSMVRASGTKGHSQSSSRFHLARSVWLHGSFRQELSVSSCRHSCSSASANGPVESRSTAGVTRSPAPSEARAAASDPTAFTARKASQKHGNAGGTSTVAGRDAAPNGRCGA